MARCVRGLACARHTQNNPVLQRVAWARDPLATVMPTSFEVSFNPQLASLAALDHAAGTWNANVPPASVVFDVSLRWRDPLFSFASLSSVPPGYCVRWMLDG